MTISRNSLDHEKIVYILRANKPRKYKSGDRSHIYYIGTTKNGASRVASSLASRAEKALGSHGIKHLEAFVVSCRPRQHVKIWVKLETALLARFRSFYYEQPFCNVHGNSTKYKWTPKLGQLFSQRRIDTILKQFE
jgi:hypothetical protein